MAVTSVTSANSVKAYEERIFREMLTDNVVAPLIGNGDDAIIQNVMKLGKGQGDQVRIALRRKLTGAGLVGDADVEDNEESMSTLYFWAYLQARANAVRSAGLITEQRSQIDIVKEMAPALRDWGTEKLGSDLVKTLSGLQNSELGWTTDGTNYYIHSTNRKWYGGQTVGSSSTAAVVESVASDSVIDDTSSGNRFGPEVIDVIKRKAQLATPPIRPGNVGGDRVFVFVIHPYQTKSLYQCYTWTEAMKHGEVRGTQNPMFRRNANLRVVGIWHDVLILESNEIEIRLGAGGSAATEYFESTDVVYNTSRVARALFLGAQAGVVAWGMKPTLTPSKADAGRKDRLTLDTIYGAHKTSYATNAGTQEDFAVITVDTMAISD